MQRFWLRGVVPLVATALVMACAEQRFRLGFEPDITSPTVSIAVPDTVDVQNGLNFTVDASDNLGLKTLSVTFTAGLTGQVLTFTTAVTTYSWSVLLPQAQTATLGGPVLITAVAADGAGNSATDTVTIIALNPKALIVTLIRPTAGAVTGPGKQIPVEVKASQQDGIQFVGWRTIAGSAAVNATDTLFDPSLPDTLLMVDTLDVPATVGAGTFSVVGFARDQSGRVTTTSPPVVVTVQLVIADTTGPLVTFRVAQRAETQDSITVRARDASGISLIGWAAFDVGGTQVGGQNTTLGGTLTDVSVTNSLNLNLASYPQTIVLKAWATDAAGNTDSARVDTLNASSNVLADSILVVYGLTKALPAGGRVADAIYNRNRNEVYLTNIDLNRLEIFSIGDTSFKTAIPVGSRPWGIALWPKDTVTGANADTVIVANSGGTDFSIVDVSLRQQRRRHPLPSYGVQTVRTVTDPQSGQLQPEITEYLFDDRPEFVGAVCRGGNCATGGSGDVIAVYSTTPTPGQSSLFSRRGSVRWEKLSDAINATTGCPVTPEDHFFWEQAEVGSKSDAADTLAIVSRRCGVETQLLHPFSGIIVTKAELGFLDTTFVRNSGNFARALVGEGGSGQFALAFARAVAYDVNAGVRPDTTDAGSNTRALNRDLGVSPDLDVRNQITNTATTLKSIAVNFNGLTNLVRADTVYVLDNFLRLKGLLQIAGPNFGLEVNFNHDFSTISGTSPSGLTTADRVAFAASRDPQIDVFDTYQFVKIASIPIRDPVIGPLRVARLPSGEQLLIGVTVKGVVTVVLPAITNPF